MHIAPESATITPAGPRAAGDFIQLRLSRDVSNSLTGDTRLLSIRIIYGVNAFTDD